MMAKSGPHTSLAHTLTIDIRSLCKFIIESSMFNESNLIVKHQITHHHSHEREWIFNDGSVPVCDDILVGGL